MAAALAVAPLGSAGTARATTQDGIVVAIQDAGQRDAEGAVLIDLLVLNDGDGPAAVPLTDMIEARLRVAGSDQTVWLHRDPADPAPAENGILEPGSFTRVRYLLHSGADEAIDGAQLSIPALSGQQVVVLERPYAGSPGGGGVLLAGEDSAQSASQTTPQSTGAQAAPSPADRTAGNRFIGNFSAYRPIYAVYGPGTDSEARLQISFKYRLFGLAGRTFPDPVREGLYFAYTQRMFWDLGAQSSPFRNIDFHPELFYQAPSRTFANGVSISAIAGAAHESNGRDGEDSRSLNTIFVSPMAAIPLTGDYRLSIAPRVGFNVGDLSDNPDIRRYRPNTGLGLEIGSDDGLRLSTAARFNFGSGKGSLGADISYPLPRIHDGLPSFYLFGQSFVGYGENLLDYDRRVTRLRIGVALVR